MELRAPGDPSPAVDASKRGMVGRSAVHVVTLRNDSPRGRWTYWEWRPPELTGLVELIWQSEGTMTEEYDRHFPDGTIELLVNLGGDRFELVEPEGAETFKTTWHATVRRAGIPYFRIYDLRSTYATRLSAGGVADEWVTQLLRQGDAQVFKKYSQMKLQMKREALQKLNRRANETAVLVQAR